uniref:Uncharacterized protein n=1 Tax=Arundo donax TaxID=35708 RepID=A0A0A9BRG9_ARUDO
MLLMAMPHDHLMHYVSKYVKIKGHADEDLLQMKCVKTHLFTTETHGLES